MIEIFFLLMSKINDSNLEALAIKELESLGMDKLYYTELVDFVDYLPEKLKKDIQRSIKKVYTNMSGIREIKESNWNLKEHFEITRQREQLSESLVLSKPVRKTLSKL